MKRCKNKKCINNNKISESGCNYYDMGVDFELFECYLYLSKPEPDHKAMWEELYNKIKTYRDTIKDCKNAKDIVNTYLIAMQDIEKTAGIKEE